MTDHLEKYKVKYNPRIFDQSQNDQIPQGVKAVIIGVYDQAQFYLHSGKYNFVAVGIPQDKVDELRGIEGILSVTEDRQFDQEI